MCFYIYYLFISLVRYRQNYKNIWTAWVGGAQLVGEAQLVGALSWMEKSRSLFPIRAYARLWFQSLVGMCARRQPINVALSHRCFSFFLSLSQQWKNVLGWGFYINTDTHTYTQTEACIYKHKYSLTQTL